MLYIPLSAWCTLAEGSMLHMYVIYTYIVFMCVSSMSLNKENDITKQSICATNHMIRKQVSSWRTRNIIKKIFILLHLKH